MKKYTLEAYDDIRTRMNLVFLTIFANSEEGAIKEAKDLVKRKYYYVIEVDAT